MRRIGTLFLQDLILAYRSGHVAITGILLALTLLLVTFLPRSLETHLEWVLDTSAGKLLETHLREEGLPDDLFFQGERAAFDAALAENPNRVGVIFSGDPAAPHFEFVTHNAVNPASLHMLEAGLDHSLLKMRGSAEPAIRVETLRVRVDAPPFNVKFIPVILVFEVVLLGFFIVAVMVFQEKAEGTARAYRVTPGGALAYILSKNLLFIVLSLIYGAVMVLYAFGLPADAPARYGALALLLILSSSLMTLLSLTVSVYYRNLTEWFFVGVAILLVNSLPMISYALPVFAPRWITALPSYPAVFAARDLLFAGAGFVQIAPTLGYLLAGNLLLAPLCYAAVRSQLMRGGRS